MEQIIEAKKDLINIITKNVRIKGTSYNISVVQSCNGSSWNSSYYELSKHNTKNKIFIQPPTKFFMPHFVDVVKAHKGESKIYYNNGKIMPREELEKYYNILMKNCWVFLNSRYVKGDGFLGLNLETIIDKCNYLIIQEEPLEECVNEDCFVELEFNSQGLPVKKSNIQQFKEGKNIFFSFPKEDCITKFSATYGGVHLYCKGYAHYSDSKLGVFSCTKSKATL